MTAFRAAKLHALPAVLLLLAAVARAQEVGTIASLEGSGEIGRDGLWTAAAMGAAIHEKDELRTSRPGRMRVVFQDDSVVTLADDSDLVVDEQVFNPSEGKARSLMEVLRGKVETLVGEYYEKASTTAEVKTRNAVAGVRGTDFVTTYDDSNDTTAIVGISGHVEVHGARDLAGHGVSVTAREITTVVRTGFPTPTRRLDDAQFRQYLEGLEFTGAGQPESLLVNDPVLAGTNVPSPDRAGALPPPPYALSTIAPPVSHEQAQHGHDAASLLQQPPAAVESASGKLRIRLF